MSQVIRSKLYREVEAILRNTGLSYSIEHGTKHDIVVLAGHRVGVMSHGKAVGCDSRKIAASIRQVIKRQQSA